MGGKASCKTHLAFHILATCKDVEVVRVFLVFQKGQTCHSAEHNFFLNLYYRVYLRCNWKYPRRWFWGDDLSYTVLVFMTWLWSPHDTWSLFHGGRLFPLSFLCAVYALFTLSFLTHLTMPSLSLQWDEALRSYSPWFMSFIQFNQVLIKFLSKYFTDISQAYRGDFNIEQYFLQTSEFISS